MSTLSSIVADLDKDDNKTNPTGNSADLNEAKGNISAANVTQQQTLAAKEKALVDAMRNAHGREKAIKMIERTKDAKQFGGSATETADDIRDVSTNGKKTNRISRFLKKKYQEIKNAKSSGQNTVRDASNVIKKHNNGLPTKDEVMKGLDALKTKNAPSEQITAYIDNYTNHFETYSENNKILSTGKVKAKVVEKLPGNIQTGIKAAHVTKNIANRVNTQTTNANSKTARLKELQSLHDKKLITSNEYNTLVKKLFSSPQQPINNSHKTPSSQAPKPNNHQVRTGSTAQLEAKFKATYQNGLNIFRTDKSIKYNAANFVTGIGKKVLANEKDAPTSQVNKREITETFADIAKSMRDINNGKKGAFVRLPSANGMLKKIEKQLQPKESEDNRINYSRKLAEFTNRINNYIDVMGDHQTTIDKGINTSKQFRQQILNDGKEALHNITK